MDPNQITQLVLAKKWIAITAIAIGLIVRLLKSDTTIPIDIPPRYRALLALGLGAASGAIEKLVAAGDTTWTLAIANGLGAAVLAMLGHDVLIGGLRDGKELAVPGLVVPGRAPAPGKPVSIAPGKNDDDKGDPPPPPPPGSLPLIITPFMVLAFAFALGSSGCALFTKGNARSLLDVAQSICVVAHQELPESDVTAVCGITEPFMGPMRELLASSRQASAKAAAAAADRAGAAKCVAPRE